MRPAKRLSRAASVVRGRPRTAAAIAAATVLALAALVWWRLVPAGPSIIAPPIPVQTLAVANPAPRPTTVVRFSDGCLTSECHASISSVSAVHAPVAQGACDACHQPDSGGHTYPLTQARQAVCSGCHDTGKNARFQHHAMSTDGCQACHDPHGSYTPALLLGKTVALTCAKCHPNAEGTARHPPYDAGECAACHDPHASDTAKLLRGGEGAEHCRRCHSQTVDTMVAAKHSHLNIKGSCLACHSPHATDHKGLLSGEARQQCVACHQDVGGMVSGAVVSHEAVLKGKQCLECHVAHASDNGVMLREDQSKVCMGCHDKPVVASDGRQVAAMAPTIAAAPMVHGPVKSGDCSACHSVHGGSHARLLKQVNPSVLEGGFDIRNYALCFSCHDQGIVLDETTTATQFRNGDKNLHWTHVRAGERSRSCATCHAVHSGQRPRLIAETVSYDGSNWKAPMGFSLSPDGGSCSPGCHEALSYSRKAVNDPLKKRQGGAP